MKNNENKSIGRIIFEGILGIIYVAGILGMYFKFISSVLDINKKCIEDVKEKEAK